MREETIVIMAIPNITEYFKMKKGETLAGTTATNSSCAYGFLNYPEKRKDSRISHH